MESRSAAGQLDRKAAEARALRNALFAVSLFTGVVLVNGILAILLIELFQVIGWWEASAAEGARRDKRGVRPLRVRAALAGCAGCALRWQWTVIRASTIELDVEPSLRGRLAGLWDRPLVIDYYASAHRGA